MEPNYDFMEPNYGTELPRAHILVGEKSKNIANSKMKHRQREIKLKRIAD